MIKVLVVDDNDDIVVLLRYALVAHGIAVDSAVGGISALASLAIETPDAVILDVQMPDMDGWETLARIRAHPTALDVPVILCTVKGRPVDAHRGWEIGCDGYVTKPFEIERLVGEVHAVTSRGAEERARVRRDALAESKRQMEYARKSSDIR